MRDDFTQHTKDVLANRVGRKCSNPKCGKATSGAARDENKDINIGVAAHICAASAGGPRYNLKMTPEERKSASNGVWLCQSCSKLIDSDVNRYTVAVLKGWKEESEHMATVNLETNYICEKKLNYNLIINSFVKIDANEPDEHVKTINLVKYFNGRFLKNEYKWEDIVNEIKETLSLQLRSNYKYYLKLTTHFSVAFMAGRIMNPKSGITSIVCQNTANGSEAWEVDRGKEKSYEKLSFRKEDFASSSNDIALVVSLTRKIEGDVKTYIEEKKLLIGEIFYCGFAMPAIDSIVDGNHAWEICKQINHLLQEHSISSKDGMLHIFVAAPVAIMFNLGKMSLSYGKGRIYDYDFEKEAKIDPGNYFPALDFAAGDWM